VYGNSGISFGKSEWSGSDHEQARELYPIDQAFGADARKIQLKVPSVLSSPCDDVAENGGDLSIGQFRPGISNSMRGTVAGLPDKNKTGTRG
jgi:hypothetical protein